MIIRHDDKFPSRDWQTGSIHSSNLYCLKYELAELENGFAFAKTSRSIKKIENNLAFKVYCIITNGQCNLIVLLPT